MPANNASIIEAIEPTHGKLVIAHMHAENLLDHVYRASIQTEGSVARRENDRKAVEDLREIASRYGYDLVPSMGGN